MLARERGTRSVDAQPVLVAFASIPIGLRGGTYRVKTHASLIDVFVTDLRFNPFLTVTSRPELAQSIPASGEAEGYTSYTWYDHPFMLRVVFGRNVAGLGSISSCATIVRPLTDGFDLDDEEALDRSRDDFCAMALTTLNYLIAILRHKARLYHVFDLRRDDIEITVRNALGAVLRQDPLHAELIREEQARSEIFDLSVRPEGWYEDLERALQEGEPLSLADDLLIEAERALAQRFPRQAIATCHTAIEAGASALLTRGMHRRGHGDREIDHVLSTRSLTSKLEVLLRSYTGFSLKQDNRSLWWSFNDLNDLRNDIVHRGKPPTTGDAEFAIRVTRDLLAWLELVRGRNK